MARWDERDQRHAERDNERLGRHDRAARLDAETQGPRWAWVISGFPVITGIGDAAIARTLGGGEGAHRIRPRAASTELPDAP